MQKPATNETTKERTNEIRRKNCLMSINKSRIKTVKLTVNESDYEHDNCHSSIYCRTSTEVRFDEFVFF